MNTNKNSSIKHVKRFAREWAMQFLYQIDLNAEPTLDSVIDNFLNQITEMDEQTSVVPLKVQNKALKTTKEIINGIIENREIIDKKIAAFSTKWSIDRMNTVDRNIMRVATYEMLFCNSVPPIVSINEAVEIGKMFGTVNSASFINGILNSIKNTLDRPFREALK
ncbi:MAG: transcription antitermination factor NusB [Victivallales bacterium]|nr:transcription antitermination factor NusB [Victivallales bacterium]MCF7889091.1 transcription antitermination factor NusB [Victivallales bacterium]